MHANRLGSFETVATRRSRRRTNSVLNRSGRSAVPCCANWEYVTKRGRATPTPADTARPRNSNSCRDVTRRPLYRTPTSTTTGPSRTRCDSSPDGSTPSNSTARREVDDLSCRTTARRPDPAPRPRPGSCRRRDRCGKSRAAPTHAVRLHPNRSRWNSATKKRSPPADAAALDRSTDETRAAQNRVRLPSVVVRHG